MYIIVKFRNWGPVTIWHNMAGVQILFVFKYHSTLLDGGGGVWEIYG